MSSSGSISSPESISSSGHISSFRTWIFGGLTLAGAGLFLYSWFQPWWTAYIVALDEIGVTIFPYALRIGGSLRDYPQWLVGAEMPAWFFPLMWVYMGICMGALVFSLFVTNEDRVKIGPFKMSLPQALIGFAGLAYIVFVVVFPIVVAIRAPQFYGAPLQGSVFIHMEGHEGNAESYVDTALQLGYWLACVTGPFLVGLALFRNKITGEPGSD